ncbi:unnamed protein product [Citrullus colocynthis]|uniref:Uncharacterized protein n=1 Tax=Citrullus colocynthis TaxID=252529 RepID=A0ABP0YQU8_9ROSI
MYYLVIIQLSISRSRCCFPLCFYLVNIVGRIGMAGSLRLDDIVLLYVPPEEKDQQNHEPRLTMAEVEPPQERVQQPK